MAGELVSYKENTKAEEVAVIQGVQERLHISV